MQFVNKCWREIMNKLVEQDVINDSLRGQHSMLKSAFLFKGLMALCVSWV